MVTYATSSGTTSTAIYTWVTDDWLYIVPTPKQRAMALLRSHLTATQCQQLDKHRWFEVRSNLGNTFRIYTDQTPEVSRNVTRMSKGRRVVSYGCEPRHVPRGDRLLAQKLAIETDETAFCDQACSYRHGLGLLFSCLWASVAVWAVAGWLWQ